MLAEIPLRLVFLFAVKGKADRSANGFLAPYMDSLAVCFNDMLADSETKSAAGIVKIPPLVSTVKSFKHPWKVFFQDANAVITDLN